MILSLAIVFISLLIFVDYLSKKRRYEISAGIPGPQIVPIFGTFHVFTIRNTKGTQINSFGEPKLGELPLFLDAFELMKKCAKLYNGFARAWILNKLSVMIARPKEVEIVLSSTKFIKKSILYDFLHIWIGSGLLISSGSKWKARRKVITPAFHFKILEEFVEIFFQQSAILVEQLEKHSDSGKSFDVFPYVRLAALDVVSETVMGVKIDAQTDVSCEYARAVFDITEIAMHRFSNIFLQVDSIFRIFSPTENRRQGEALKIVHHFTENVIEKRRISLKSESENGLKANADDHNGAKIKMPLLDILLKSKINEKPLSNAEIREEVDTFMFEGHDTTTSGICYTLYLISRHPEVQRKMVQEIRCLWSNNKDKPISRQDLQELKYMECVIKESLRLYPPVPIIGRQFTEDANVGKYRIPAGTNVIIPLFILMNDPEYFPDPQKFDPERHMMSATEKTNRYAFIPFSAGPRNCIAQKFAMLQMKIIISKILQHYELLPMGEAPDPVVNIVLKSTNGINIGIRPRYFW